MTTQNDNPFVLPGLGQSGDLGQNPLMASMEMMRQAWQGLAGSNAGTSAMAPPMTLEELDRRIADLRTVENWLRMNLSMLNGAIQGLEVQRATITTLKSFMDMTAGAPSASQGPSPLDIALGIKHAPGAASNAKKPAAAASVDSTAATAGAAAQGWWDLVRKQFDTLAAATAATMQDADALKKAAGSSSSARSAKSTVKSAASAKPARKAAPRKRTTSGSAKTRS